MALSKNKTYAASTRSTWAAATMIALSTAPAALAQEAGAPAAPRNTIIVAGGVHKKAKNCMDRTAVNQFENITGSATVLYGDGDGTTPGTEGEDSPVCEVKESDGIDIHENSAASTKFQNTIIKGAKPATAENLKAAVASSKGPLTVFLSDHGMRDSTASAKPEFSVGLWNKVLGATELRSILDSSATQPQVLVIDTCFAEGILQEAVFTRSPAGLLKPVAGRCGFASSAADRLSYYEDKDTSAYTGLLQEAVKDTGRRTWREAHDFALTAPMASVPVASSDIYLRSVMAVNKPQSCDLVQARAEAPAEELADDARGVLLARELEAAKAVVGMLEGDGTNKDLADEQLERAIKDGEKLLDTHFADQQTREQLLTLAQEAYMLDTEPAYLDYPSKESALEELESDPELSTKPEQLERIASLKKELGGLSDKRDALGADNEAFEAWVAKAGPQLSKVTAGILARHGRKAEAAKVPSIRAYPNLWVQRRALDDRVQGQSIRNAPLERLGLARQRVKALQYLMSAAAPASIKDDYLELVRCERTPVQEARQETSDE